MAIKINVKSGKYLVGVGFLLLGLGLVFNGFILGLGIMIIIFGVIYSIVGDIEIKWKCENCGKKFNLKKFCENHEKKCDL